MVLLTGLVDRYGVFWGFRDRDAMDGEVKDYLGNVVKVSARA